MEPEQKQIKMTANVEDADSSINSEEVPAAVTKKGGNSDQSGMYLNDVAVCSTIMAESVCSSIPLEKEIGVGPPRCYHMRKMILETLTWELKGYWPISAQRMSDVRLHIHSKN